MWHKFTSVQGSKIEKALESGLSLTTRHDSSIKADAIISLSSYLEEWECSNPVAIEHALETKQFQDPLSLFVSPEDIQASRNSQRQKIRNTCTGLKVKYKS
ncbi:hypothetical protein DM860_006030 [Cuscuta australis]|uniref:Uncharacterized protein n=1 Tax=Cuscuta australis TaxID=267555 RepID=A0A328DKA0_9ASTE|nr:hypothetical protein DM860_006030 [Cuscuta australis]